MGFNVITRNKIRSKKFLKFFFNSGGSLSEKTIRGSIWLFLLRFTDRFFRFGRTIILARLLSPNDFGLFGVVLVSLSIVDAFTRPGIRAALIQKKEESRSYLDTAWTIEVVRGLVIAVVLFLISPYIAIFFGAKEAEPMIKMIGLVVFLQGLTNIAVVYFEKELRFNKFFVYQFMGTVVDVVVTIIAVLIIHNVWALIFGLLAGHIVRLFVSYIIESYRPRLYFGKKEAKELFGFGKWVLGSNVLNYLVTQGDSIIVGRVLGATSLGFYQMAYRNSNMVSTEIVQIISRVAFPAYSKIQTDLAKLKEAYLKILQIIAFISFPITGLVLVLAYDFTVVVLGEKWLQIVPVMQILVIAGLFRSLISAASPIFPAIGKPEITTRLQSLNLLIIVLFIYPLVVILGMIGASLVMALSSFILSILFNYTAVKIVGYKIKSLVMAISLPLINTLITALIVFGVKSVIGSGVLELILLIVVGFLSYLSITYIFYKTLNYGVSILDNLRLLTKG